MNVQHGYYKKQEKSKAIKTHFTFLYGIFESHSAVNHPHYFGHIFKQPKLFPQWEPNSISSKPLKSV